jgi:ferritin
MNNVLISDNLKSAFEVQISHERYNATVYLYVAGWFRSHGCENLAKFFLKQHEEEISHSLIIFDLLTDLNVFPDIPSVDGCNMEFSDIKTVADLFLQREIETTNSLNALKQLSIDENNPVAEERMRQMLIIQQSEYAEATDFSDKAYAMDDLSDIILWDLSLKD